MILTDEEIETVRNAALLSFRRHQSSVRGQQITQRDDPEYHLICAIESAVLEKLKTQEPALVRYKKHTIGDEEPNTVERLRFFLSLALTGQNWLDVEKFLDDLPPDDVVQKYEELLYEVHRKFPDETRHQTALRYIKTAESPSHTNAAME